MFAAERSAGIDVLRGICVLLVTLHHIHLRFRHNRFDVGALLPQPIARVVFGSGYFAVITFFTISGFLITSLSLRRWASLDRIPLRQFYWLRFARIVPCLLLLVALLSVLHLAQVKQFVIPPERSSLGRAVLAALTFHVNWLEGHHGYLPGSWDVLWSLSVEEVFYLLFPVLCLSLRSVRWLLVPLVALILIGPLNRVALAGREPWADYAYLSCMDGIAFGCLAALLTARLRVGRNPLRWMMAIGIVLVSLIVVFRGLSASLGLHQVGLGVTILELGVALMLIALAQGIGRDGLARGTGTLCMVGRSSYEIYLTHMLVILGLLPLILESKPEGSAIVVWYVGLLISSVALGWLVNKVYSEPLNRALRARLALLALLPLLFACAPVSVATQPSAVLGPPAPVASIGANPTVTRAAEPATQLGLDVLAAENFARLRGAHVALLTNDTARAGDGTRSLDALAAAPGVSVVALFTPEHGQAANKDEAIPDAVDARWSIPVYSLYGKQTSPDPELLRGVDTVVVDLPDAGVRFYTYASTVHGMLRVAAQLGLRVILLDRPNPLDAVTIAGPMLDPSEASWVNHHALPIRHGMTLGELAKMISADEQLGIELDVVRMQGYRRSAYFDETGLRWWPPSPNLRTVEQAVLYPAVALVEGTNVSVGRGTEHPFELMGAPWLDAESLLATLQGYVLAGVSFSSVRFKPNASLYAGKDCSGVSLRVTDRARFEPVRTGIALALSLRRLHRAQWQTARLHEIIGQPAVTRAILALRPLSEIEALYRDELEVFRGKRQKYLLYP